MADRVSIIGAGSWGMALARLLSIGGSEVRLWEFDPSEYRTLVEHRSNPSRLKSFRLPDAVELTDDLTSAVEESDYLVVATPSQHVRAVLSPIRGHCEHTKGVINVAKGIEKRTLKRMSQVITDALQYPADRVATLSGPSHAEEVILDVPTTAVVASPSESFAREVQRLFSDNSFRVYVSDDLVGVELGGALKNIVAIAAGIADGLGMGDNTKGALITRGLAEITRLGIAAGARAETFAGLSGIGDLVTTCMSRHSRNRLVGERVGRGEKLDAVLSDMTMIAEGVETTRSGWELARQHKIEMPITNEIYKVLFDNKPPSEAVADLMGRELKAEIW
jgi:glycerol-3-phosphate dehydrogenase (NAD(P)+)